MELPRRANERTEFPNRISRQTCTFRRPARAFLRSERGLRDPFQRVIGPGHVVVTVNHVVVTTCMLVVG